VQKQYDQTKKGGGSLPRNGGGSLPQTSGGYFTRSSGGSFSVFSTMAEQKEELENTFNDWKMEFEQVDDVLVVGIKI